MIYIKHEKSDIMTNESYHIKICMNISVQKLDKKQEECPQQSHHANISDWHY